MEEENNTSWGTRGLYLMAALTQTMGVSAFVSLPYKAVSDGATGHIICFCLAYILLGIPLVYMEYVIAQFTARDCLDVWKARPCFSHFGYIHVIWQFVFILYCHTTNSFILHYFLISFESPTPYYECGNWTDKNCNILMYNYTVNQDCIRRKDPKDYCEKLFFTFPESQYWRYQVLGLNRPNFHIAWRVGLASGILCVVIYLNCFRRAQSMKWILGFVTVYPIAAYTIFMIASMMQKGIVLKFEESMDTDFELFIKNFDLSSIVAEAVYSLNIGTGVSFNLAAGASFRNPAYSNTVIAVVSSCGLIVLTVCTTALMSCPYAFQYGIRTNYIMTLNTARIFEKMPRFLQEYDSKSFWLILLFSGISTSATGLNTIYISGLLELLTKRYPRIALYPRLVTLLALIVLYFATIPLLGNLSLFVIVTLKRAFNLIAIFAAIVESAVFILWYGLGRFSEDVHFMQGTQPRNSVKAGWVICSVLLVYVFFSELYKLYSNSEKPMGTQIGWWTLIITLVWAVSVLLIKILVSLCKNMFNELVGLDPTWGPKSELLQRSRAMFSAQAMTKEYMYRQYHLQAGILARQRKSNVRNPSGTRV